MNTLPALPGFTLQAYPARQDGSISLLLHTREQTPHLLELAAYLGMRGSLLALDGGNCFNIYTVAAALYRLAPAGAGRHAFTQAVLQRIRAARAFTCFQMAALVHQALTLTRRMPVLALEFLTTFQDENIPLRERKRLLTICLGDLKGLAQSAPVLATVRASSAQPLPAELLNMTMEAASEIWTGAALSCNSEEAQPTRQLLLFGE